MTQNQSRIPSPESPALESRIPGSRIPNPRLPSPGFPLPRKRNCTHLTAAGQPCRAWAVRGTDPPRCAPHGGRRPASRGPEFILSHALSAAEGAVEGPSRRVGAPPGNQNALKHGFTAAGSTLSSLVGADSPSDPGLSCAGLPSKEDTGSPAQDSDAFTITSAADAVNQLLAGLLAKLDQIDRLIQGCDPANTATLIRLFALYTQVSARVGQLLRVRQAVGGDKDDRLTSILDQVLDELGEEWGIDL